MIETLTHWFFTLSGWWVSGVVFGLTFAECAVLFGFIFPAEIAVILGGVLCSRGDVSLWQDLPAAITGAIAGDSIGYALGNRIGAPFLARKVGTRWKQVQALLQRRGAAAVFLGRFTAFLRATIPSAAGAVGVPYRVFLLWNVMGGVVWATAYTMLGYAGGESYPSVLKYAGIAGWVVIGIIAAAVAVAVLWHRHVQRRAQDRTPGVQQ